jgi:CheY-like chemotaxis protein
MSSRFHGETNTIPRVVFTMVRPLVLVVRETPSLADSVQILLETVGFRVVSFGSLSSALDRIEDRAAEPIRAVVVACNQAYSETLRGYPESFPAEARDVPLLVVGQRALQGGRKWPANVRSLGLPLDSGALVTALAHLTGIEAAGPPASAR